MGLVAEHRYLILAVADDAPDNLKRIHVLVQTFKRWPQILGWCAKNQLTGKKLESFWVHECKGSPLSFAMSVIKRMDRARPSNAPLTVKELISP